MYNMMNRWGNWNMMGAGGWSGLGGGIILVILWTFVWKGLALWRAAREENKGWFVALLVLNTLGILEIIYLFFVAKEKLNFSSPAPKKSTSKSKK